MAARFQIIMDLDRQKGYDKDGACSMDQSKHDTEVIE
jgi:hypothetical protein